jgi:hypothetical protein
MNSDNNNNNIIVEVDKSTIENKKKEQIEASNNTTSVLDQIPDAAVGYREVDEMLKEAFNYKESNSSMICDIIAMYLKGQKILYTEAKTLCEQRLNSLMLPTICITAICAVISVVLKEYPFSSTVVSSLNGVNFFFLTLINYLKLDAKAEAHRVSAYKFDKIQSRLEFASGKILFIVGEAKELPKIINDTEKDVREIKETNQFILPEYIRYNFPKLVNMNIFAEVKKIQNEETELINALKDVLNDDVNLRLKIQSTPTPLVEDLEKQKTLDNKKKILTDGIIRMKNKYLAIDELYEKELKELRQKFSKKYQICGCLKT